MVDNVVSRAARAQVEVEVTSITNLGAMAATVGDAIVKQCEWETSHSQSQNQSHETRV